MTILITGANGQLGKALKAALEDLSPIALNRSDFDLQNGNAKELLNKYRPSAVINAAAYTAVDKAETDSETANIVNHTAVNDLAIACKDTDTRLFHISTDFVFDGTSNIPYEVDSSCQPLGVYGQTKLKGEQAIQQHLPDNSCIIRTAWLYSHNTGNFVTTMLRLMKEKSELGIVSDQVGTPTSTETLALFIRIAIQKNLQGVFHWTDSGVASWYDFAIAIYEEATSAGLLKNDITIKPIFTRDYPTPAKRPHFSVLDKSKSIEESGLSPTHWRTPLRDVIKKIAFREQHID